MEQEIERTTHYKAGYDAHTGKWRRGEGDHWTPMRWATTPDGAYIGTLRDAHRLCVLRGIRPELRTGTSNTCSVGFSEREQKWYGWSHRAIFGFGIGDVVEEGDLCATSGWTDEYLKDHPDDNVLPVGFKALTLNDAKRMAIAFAASVS